MSDEITPVEELPLEDQKKAINLQDLAYVKQYIDMNHYDKNETDAMVASEIALQVGAKVAETTYSKTEVDANHYTKKQIDDNHYTKIQTNETFYKKTDTVTNAINATHSVNADKATNADYAANAAHATTATNSDNATNAVIKDDGSYAGLTIDENGQMKVGGESISVGHATEADSAATATYAQTAATAENVENSNHAETAGHATNATFADNATNAEYARYASEDTSKGTIEERLTSLGFKEADILYSGNVVGHVKRQGNYVLGTFTLPDGYSSYSDPIVIPEGFRPKETLTFPAYGTITLRGYASGSVPTFVESGGATPQLTIYKNGMLIISGGSEVQYNTTYGNARAYCTFTSTKFGYEASVTDEDVIGFNVYTPDPMNPLTGTTTNHTATRGQTFEEWVNSDASNDYYKIVGGYIYTSSSTDVFSMTLYYDTTQQKRVTSQDQIEEGHQYCCALISN